MFAQDDTATGRSHVQVYHRRNPHFWAKIGIDDENDLKFNP